MSESNRAVFLSYAHEDAIAARRIAEALRAIGVEVWFDQSELRGGDAWDQKIRHQIKECALFIPIVSTNTQERGEGYFRLEWKLAVERTHHMAEGIPFLTPVALDRSHEADALVPTEFMRVHWTRLPNGEPTPEFVDQIKRILHAPRKSTAMRKAESAGAKFAEASASSAAPLATPPPAAAASPAQAAAPAPAQSRSARWFTLALVGLFIAVIAYVALRPAQKKNAAELSAPSGAETKSTAASLARARDKSVPGAKSPAADNSIAVLAFADLSAAHDSEYFSDGISEELLNVLAKVPGLKVTARTSAFYFKGKNLPIPEIAKQLGVAYVVEGTVQHAGDNLRITAQLIKAADGFHVWSDTFTRELKDIFALQDEIAGLIAKQLSLQLGTGAAAASAPVDPEAYRLGLLARAFLVRGGNEDFATAIRHLQEAVARDPKFALGFALLSLSHAGFAANGWEPYTSGFEAARAAALRALELQPDLSEAHAAIGWVQYGFDWDWAAARASFQKAVDLAPSEASAQDGLARVAITLGQHDEGLRLARRAVELNPLDNFSLGTLCNAQLHAGAWEGIPLVEARQRELNGLSYGYAAMALLLQGQNEAAGQAARLATPQNGVGLFIASLVQWSLGRTAESDATLNEVKMKYSEAIAYQIAEAYAWRGAADQAFEWLETSYRQRDTGMIWLKTDPLLKKLHTDPRWPVLLRKMKLSDEQLK